MSTENSNTIDYIDAVDELNKELQHAHSTLCMVHAAVTDGGGSFSESVLDGAIGAVIGMLDRAEAQVGHLGKIQRSESV